MRNSISCILQQSSTATNEAYKFLCIALSLATPKHNILSNVYSITTVLTNLSIQLTLHSQYYIYTVLTNTNTHNIYQIYMT